MLLASSSVTATCVSLMLSLAGLSIPDVHVPDVTRTADLNITALRCADLTLGGAVVEYNSHATAVALRNATDLQCSADIAFRLTAGAAASSGRLELGVRLPAHGRFNVTTATRPGSCLAANVTASTCTLEPELTQLALADPKGPDAGLVALVLSLAKSTLATDLRGAVCGKALAGLEHQLTNHTLDPLAPYPPLRPGASDLRKSRFIEAAVNIATALPVLADMHITAALPAPNVIAAALETAEPVSLNAGSFHVVVPRGMRLTLDVVAIDAVCDMGSDVRAGCAFHHGVELINVRLSGGGEVNRLVDNFIGLFLSGEINHLVESSSFFENSTLSLGMNTPIPITWPNPAVMLPLAAVLLGLQAVVMYFCSFRSLRRRLPPDTPLTRACWRKLLDDYIIVFGCSASILLFAWSNMSSSAELVIGKTMNLYVFSLMNTVTDLWRAGLKPLSFFIMLFSGVYPYFKLLVIVFVAVVLQRPESNILMAIDGVGKFSLLDCFVMTQLANALALKGIADVNTLPSFYVFIAASVSSILVGNYATRSHRRDAAAGDASSDSDEPTEDTVPKQLSPGSGSEEAADEARKADTAAAPDAAPDAEASDRGLNASLLDYDQLLEAEDEPPHQCCQRGVAKAQPYRPYVSLPIALCIGACSVVAAVYPTFRYDMTGLAALITGSRKDLPLYELFEKTITPLFILCMLTVFILPTLFAAGFPRIRLLSAWCATDAFLLGAVAGLLQAERFIKYVMGPSLSTMLQVHTDLLWPIYALTFSMALQWFLIVRTVLRW